MKKIKTILLSIVAFAAVNFNFTFKAIKPILAISSATAAYSAKSQNVSTYIDNANVIIPQITQTLTGVNITIDSGVNSFTLTNKRQQVFTGNTNSSGVVTFTFTAYSAAPNIQYALGFGTTNKETIIPNAATTTTSCAYYVQARTDALGLLPAYSNVNNREVNVIVTEK